MLSFYQPSRSPRCWDGAGLTRSSRPPRPITCAFIVLVGCLGCNATFGPADGLSPPAPLPVLGAPLGPVTVVLDDDSVTPPSAYFAARDVAQRFARRLENEGVFAPVDFRDSPLDAPSGPSLRTTVRLTEEWNEGANTAKEFFHVLTLFVFLPVLPLRASYEVDLSVTALDASGRALGRYASKARYDLEVARLGLPEPVEDAWLAATADRAIGGVVNQIKQDSRAPGGRGNPASCSYER